MKNKEMYYYNPKYPEFGISVLPIDDIAEISYSVMGDKKYLHSVYSKYDIETGLELDWTRGYTLYCPYEEDDDMFMYDLPGNRERILSFNREKLVEWWREDLRVTKNKLVMRLKDVEECINQK